MPSRELHRLRVRCCRACHRCPQSETLKISTLFIALMASAAAMMELDDRDDLLGLAPAFASILVFVGAQVGVFMCWRSMTNPHTVLSLDTLLDSEDTASVASGYLTVVNITFYFVLALVCLLEWTLASLWRLDYGQDPAPLPLNIHVRIVLNISYWLSGVACAAFFEPCLAIFGINPPISPEVAVNNV